MSFKPEQVAALKEPLSTAHVRKREQSGRKLDYIEGWHAIAEANRVFGFDGWTRETLSLTRVSELPRKVGKVNARDGWSVSYMAHVKVTVLAGDRVVVREGTGTGHGIDVDLGLAHESAAKEAETDAMKRALMTFGNPFGLALYDKTQANVVAPRSAPLEMALTAARLCKTKAELRSCLAQNKAALDPQDAHEFRDACQEMAASLPETEQKDAA
jgi:DNA repair and recombination protein RAD52